MEEKTNLVTNIGNGMFQINERIRINGADISPTQMNDVPINGFQPSILVNRTAVGHYEGNTFVIERIR